MSDVTREKNTVRLLNPTTTKRGGRARNLVRLLNPEFVGSLIKTKSDAEALSTFKRFRGREPKSIKMVEARRGTPATLAELGGLVELVLDDFEDSKEPRARMKTIRALKLRVSEDEDGDKVLKFNAERVKLAAGGDGDMHIVGFYKARPEGFEAGKSYFLGSVLLVTYRADKPHIETGEQDYEHEFAEHGGDLPRLYYKDGYLFFRGGTYTLTKHGIEG